MPSLPAKYCARPGCRNIAPRGKRYCPKHQQLHDQNIQRHNDRQRGTAAQRGYDGKWRKAREGFLAKHPFCVECEREGRTELATVVDHIIPHRGDMTLFWDRENWQPLCSSCHSAKTAREDGAFGNKRGNRWQ